MFSMQRYIAFLRGINVGGHTVLKTQLQEAFTALGFTEISTFKQSGNVIFETPKTNPTAVAQEIEAKLSGTLGFAVAVFVRTIPQLKAILHLDAFKGQNAEGTSFLVTFLPGALQSFPLPLPITIPKSTAQIIVAEGAEVYSVTHGGGEGALPNPYVEKTLKIKATTRNLNVIRDIAEKYN